MSFQTIVRIFILLAAASGIDAQTFGGKIEGVVTDSNSGAIPRVSVKVLNEGTGTQRTMLTDGTGIYAAAELPVGYYTVQFELSGFAKAETQRVKVDVGGETRVDIILSIQNTGNRST